MIALFLAILAASPFLQAPRDARVTVTVVDQTGAVIPNATVTVIALDAQGSPAAASAAAPAKTNDKGIVEIANLAPGRYNVQAEFPGFDTRLLKDIRLKSGDNKHVAVLAIQGLQDSVTVSRDAREAASDRRSTFATAMTREQIEALSEDPDEMAQQLQDIAGGGATIRVDSFEGGRLPPKSAIKAIHITRDAFAAENHYAGGLFIDIITQPGIGPLRTNLNFRLRDGSLSGAPHALPYQEAPQPKGPEQLQYYNGGIGGSLIKQKASFNINAQTNTSYDTPYYNYTLPDGTSNFGLAPRRPRDTVYVYGLFDYAITRDQTLRFNVYHDQSTSKNLGIGNFDMAQRGYNNDDHSTTFRVQEAGPLGRRFFINTRANISSSAANAHSLFEGPTVVVLSQFTAGGQQRRGGSHSQTVNLQSDLDYVRGIHSMRAGVQFDGGSYHSDDSTNYYGTYTFTSEETYLAGLPRSFTQRIGDPNIDYKNVQAGLYLQDDIRVRKNLTLSPGVRYEAQTHLSDYNNFGPRVGVTWSPGKAGAMTVRGSAGIFYDWLSSGTYEQTLRVDPTRQQEINIQNPSFPDPSGGISAVTASNRYLLADDLHMQRNTRFSAGIDRGLTKKIRINANYAYTLGSNLMRGLNLNPVLNVFGDRADPRFANVIEVVGDAESRAHTLNVGATINFNVPGAQSGGPVMISNGGGMIMISGSPAGPAPGGAKNPANARWNWHRMQIFTNLGLGHQFNNTSGAFSTPTTGNLADDWGPANFDIRRRFNVSLNSSQLRNFNANLNFNASSAPPYTILSGLDTNRDLIFNDRPDGVERNSARASAQWNMNGFFTYGWTFGKPTQLPGGISLGSERGAITATQGAASTQGRFRVSLNVQIQNITNHGNLSSYQGTLTAPHFGQPLSINGTRKIDVGMGISF
jgi:hypothetical protein